MEHEFTKIIKQSKLEFNYEDEAELQENELLNASLDDY
jgi:hypothetical protein